MQIPSSPPPGPFFASSEDEGDDINMAGVESEVPHSSLPTTPRTSSSRSSPPHRLFLEDSDDDVNDIYTSESPSVRRPIVVDDVLEIDIDSAATHAKAGQSKPTEAFKKSSSPPHFKQGFNSGPPLKKRRLSPQDTHNPTSSFPPTYLGEVLITNAWSNVSGKGYVKPNESIQIQRDEVTAPKPGPSKPTKSVNKKSGDGKKQLSLATMLKPQPTNIFKKKKVDTIVRLVNSRGFGLHICSPPDLG
jgi:DNA repair protein RAD5